MFKIYSKDGQYIQIPADATPDEGWVLECETTDANYLVDIRIARIEEIKNSLNNIDFKSIRPLREGNTALVAQYEAEAEALRIELRALLA